MFYRKIQEKLSQYYADKDAPIVVVSGARQIGKSFIIRETARRSFENYIEINLMDDAYGNRLFAGVNSVKGFYFQVSALYGDHLGDANDTIIFLDEIQVYPNLISLLKPLKAESRFRYIASGSLLGVTLKKTFIPMGSMEIIQMFPMDFEEFLLANRVGKDVIDYLRDCFANLTPVEDGIHRTMLSYFRQYLICGGMPDAVKELVLNSNILRCRNIQSQIFEYYGDDASQYSAEHKLKIKRIYDFMPSYMENKVKRLQFRKIDNNHAAGLAMYQDEFDYLISSGCTLGVRAISNPVFPLCESQSKNLIKLYYNDVGILSNILYSNNIAPILNYDKAVNLGSIYETACAMELAAHGHRLYYFDSKKVGEVDFLINYYSSLSVLPIEIKSGNDQNNFRAIPKLVSEPYDLPEGFIFGNENLVRRQDRLVTYPIYMIMFV